MKVLQFGLVAGLAVVMVAFGAGCRKKKTLPPPAAEQPAEEPAPAVAAAPATPPAPVPPTPVQGGLAAPSADQFQTSTEFEDLTKDFQMYCNFKKRVPTDINEFFRDQKIKPPIVPPGMRLTIDRENRRILLVK